VVFLEGNKNRRIESMSDTTPATISTRTESAYASVNGLDIYYEIHGSGRPLVLLHGGLSTIGTDFGQVLQPLAETRRTIGIEQQGHGHTADIDRPLTYEQMAEDTATLLRQLEVEQADFFGYSMGGGIALQIAMRHPELVRKLVPAGGTAYRPDGLYPEILEGIEHMTPEALAGSEFEKAYARTAPRPENWPALIARMQELDAGWKGWSPEDIQSIAAPTLVIIGDSDIVRPEHAVELFRLLGGGVPGDLAGLPRSQLAVLPGATHVGLVDRADWLISMVTEFLDAPMPAAA
jgi:pimeloyl-ACP methyl ester carboxylesterase